MRLALATSCLVMFFTRSVYGDDTLSPYFLESYPDHIQARLEIVARLNRQHDRKVGRDLLEGVVEEGRIWRPSTIVTVAFLGGSNEMLAKVANVADEWTRYGNISFSFKDNDGAFRHWSRADSMFSADVRVSFDERGYWSLVGTESRDPRIARPDEPSLNLGQFDRGLPRHWESIVLHEFGHAIGFQHEHQHPRVKCDFRWDDDPGYQLTRDPNGQFVPDRQNFRPGIYTVLSGPPNEWSKAKTEFNLMPLRKESRAYIFGDFDSKSVMLYSLPAWMFRAYPITEPTGYEHS